MPHVCMDYFTLQSSNMIGQLSFRIVETITVKIYAAQNKDSTLLLEPNV